MAAIDKSLVLDFGMHEGEDTDFYLACGAKVIAFEANPVLTERNHCRYRQAIAEGQLDIVSGAIVPPDFEGKEQTFYVDGQKSIWGTTSLDWVRRNASRASDIAPVTVPAIDLSALLTKLPAVLYAKIDVEGADTFVLDTFRRSGVTPQYVSIESDKIDLQNIIEEIETLQDLGYDRFAAVQQATIPGSSVHGTRLDGQPFGYRFKKHSSGPFGPYLQQPYKTAHAVIDDYRAIFRAYERYGDRSRLMRPGLARSATRLLNFALLKSFGRPLCGWYDTHAAR